MLNTYPNISHIIKLLQRWSSSTLKTFKILSKFFQKQLLFAFYNREDRCGPAAPIKKNADLFNFSDIPKHLTNLSEFRV